MKRLTLLLLALIFVTPADAACWQWSRTASANATADASINLAEGMSPSSVNDSARAMMARLAECRDDISGLLVTGGSSTAYTVTTNQGVGSPPQDGQQIVARFHTANGASPTLAADGGTAYAIQTKVGTAVASATLQTDGVYRLTFKLSATAWLLQDFYNAPIATNSVTYDKIQQASASRLIGNPTGSTANVQEISLGAGLSFSGTSLVATVDPTAIPGYISGLELSTAGGSTTFSVAKGGATDVNYSGTIYLAASISKTTASWAVGSGNGALDQGSITTNAWYHAFVIKRPDTGVSDVCISTATTGCAAGVGNIPAAYTLKRRIGSLLTNGVPQWVGFTQIGNEFIWASQVVETVPVLNAVSRTNITLTVPTGVSVMAKFRAPLVLPGSNVVYLFTSLFEADGSSGTIGGDLGTASGGIGEANVARITNTSGQIGGRIGTLTGTPSIITYAWTDFRGM